MADRVDAVVALVDGLRRLEGRGNVSLFVVAEGVGPHRRLGPLQVGLVDEVVEHFVLDLDRADAVFRLFGPLGRDRRDDVAVVLALALLGGVLEEVDGLHAGNLLRRLDVERLDLRVGVLAGEELRVERPLAVDVVRVLGVPCGLLGPVDPGDLLADVLVVLPGVPGDLAFGHHAPPFAAWAFASSRAHAVMPW